MVARTSRSVRSGQVDHRVDDLPSPVVSAVLAWYDDHARPLPWREVGTSAWGVLVSEVMAQQTPVDRVVPSWQAWMQRWPTPSDLADATPAEVIRMWGRLGYPRRAMRLRETAIACVERHAGRVPSTHEELLALPGVGDYTASAVMAFAHGRAAVVLDTNVRRVLARCLGGEERVGPAPTKGERERARALLPADDAAGARWAQAVMELGALVCTASAPRCEACPVAAHCAWLAAGRPTSALPAQRAQRYAGTDRQVRGRLLDVLRASSGPVDRARLDVVWLTDTAQRDRALDSLLVDGLVEQTVDGRFALAGEGD